MAVARAESVSPSPNPLWFNLATEWIMKDLAKGLEDPRFPKKLHEALWWGNIRWALILAVGVTGVAVAKDYIDKNIVGGGLQPEPNSTPAGVPASFTQSLEDLKTSTPRPSETLTPTRLPTFTLAPTETPTSTATSTPTEKPPTPTPTRTPKPTKEYVPPPSPTAMNVEPVATRNPDIPDGWPDDSIENPPGSGGWFTPLSPTIPIQCVVNKVTDTYDFSDNGNGPKAYRCEGVKKYSGEASLWIFNGN